jgi:hypothetical protein
MQSASLANVPRFDGDEHLFALRPSSIGCAPAIAMMADCIRPCLLRPDNFERAAVHSGRLGTRDNLPKYFVDEKARRLTA